MSSRLQSIAERSGRVAVLVLVAVVLGSCTAGSATATASMESPIRPQRPSELAPSGPGGDWEMPDISELPDISEIPGFSELPDLPAMPELPDLGGSGECTGAMTAFTELTILGVMPGGESRVDELADQLRAALPSGLQDDLETVVAMIEEASAAGLLAGADLLMSEEFASASSPIFDWIAQGCPGAQAD